MSIQYDDEEAAWRWTVAGAAAVLTSRRGGCSAAPFDTANVGLHAGDDPSCVARNRERSAQLLDLARDNVAGVTQVHGADVWLDLGTEPSLAPDVVWDDTVSPIEADALVTARAGRGIAVGVADCMPIALVAGDAVAAVHAGWRSLAAGVVEATIAAMQRAAGTSAALATVTRAAVIGPSLCVRCMEVGDDVAARFDRVAIVRRDEWRRPHLDTRADAARRLTSAGFLVEHIDTCTRCDERLFSHRGDGARTGRQALIIRRT